MTQPITAAPTVELTFGLGTAVGAGVFLNDSDPLDPDKRWRASQGFAAEGPPCVKGTYTGDICSWPGPNENVYAPLMMNEPGYPFMLGAGVRCSTMGSPSAMDLGPWHAAADRLLDLTQWSSVANELWTGAQNTASSHTSKHLADASATTLGTGAQTPIVAISLLEQAFSTIAGGPRLIHMSPQAISYLKAKQLIDRQGQRWYTALGSLIVADDGYPGTSPAGAAAATGTTWIYGTGPITARLDSAIFHPEPDPVSAVRVRTNDVIVRAQKLAAVTWLCGHYAVQMSLADP